MSGHQASSVLTSRYATALLDLAADQKAIEKVEKDMAALRGMLNESTDFQTFVSSPLVSHEDAVSALNAIGKKAKFQKLTLNFLGVLVENKRLYTLGGIIDSFQKLLSARRDEVIADVISASPLSGAQEKEIAKMLSKELGCDVIVNAHIDETILGGLIVKIGSQMIDNSVARKLERLKSALVCQDTDILDAKNAPKEKAA